MKQTYCAPLCEVVRVVVQKRLCAGSLNVYDDQTENAGWAKETEEPDYLMQRHNLWDD